jgi:hypothetical protein
MKAELIIPIDVLRGKLREFPPQVVRYLCEKYDIEIRD